MRLYTHSSCLTHEVPEGHPERAERLRHLLSHIETIGLSQDIDILTAPTASAEDILRVHTNELIAQLERARPSDTIVAIDADTWMAPNSLTAALDAAGAVCQGVDDVITGVTDRVFCAVRPPGHHAEHDTAMGFCLFNSIAIAAARALDLYGIERIAILDFDVHHGNGTVDVFKDDPRVLVCSSFQHPYYPHRFADIDRPNIVNTPLEAGSDGNQFRSAVETQWLPALQAHAPELVLISAGFDAHRLDPLANINLTEEDFAWVTQMSVAQANESAQGRIVSTLEGGYDLAALASSTETHILSLM